MPAPKDSLLAYVLYNAAVSITIVAGLVRTALVFLGLAVRHPWEEGEEHQLAAIAAAAAASTGPSLADRFRSRFRPSRFGRRRAGADCRVCLAGFKPESVVNRLPCGHLFHRACLETWLDYDHATCPLCRHRLLPAGADDWSSPSLAQAPSLARI
jgi:RING/U-box domain-containing protein